jgi:methionine synthase II (cobalamin-independent)
VRRSDRRIITTHVGSLSRPPELLALNAAKHSGAADTSAYAKGLTAAVAAVVTKQREVGIDVANDGEFGKPMSAAYDYGAWWNYAFERLEGFAAPDSIPESKHKKSAVAALLRLSPSVATGNNSANFITIRRVDWSVALRRDGNGDRFVLGLFVTRATRRQRRT